MTTPSLYQLTAEYRALIATLSDLDIDAKTARDTIESTGLQESIAERVQARMFAARSIRASKDAVTAEIKRLTALEKHKERMASTIEDSTLHMLQGADLSVVECPLMIVRVRSNPASVEITDADALPAQYLRTPEPPPPAPDKTAIKEALAHGTDVPGARLVQKQRLAVS